jgi:hypothetical protein
MMKSNAFSDDHENEKMKIKFTTKNDDSSYLSSCGRGTGEIPLQPAVKSFLSSL